MLGAGPQRLVAQRFVCYTPEARDRPVNLALSVTGGAPELRKPSLPTADSKSPAPTSTIDYDLSLVARRVCVAEDMVRNAQPVHMFSLQTWSTTPPPYLWLVVPVLLTILLVWTATWMYVDERAWTLDAMRQFGDKFIRQFEAPLVQTGSLDRPIESRLRLMAYRKRLEILIAPAGGRHYPNLFDHRSNLAYDVERVLELVADQQFVFGRVSGKGRWVVIPFEFKGVWREEGTT